MKRDLLPVLLWFFLLCSCAHKTLPTPDRPPSASLRDNTRQFEQAEIFDQFVRGTLTEATTLKRSCRKNNDNLFCWSVKREKMLRNYSLARTRTPPAPTPKLVIPAKIRIQNNQITNWLALRRKDIPELLKGIEELSPQHFEIVRKRAHRDTKCPNNPAVAVAAHLEEQLPNKGLTQEIAELYAKSGRCRNHSAADRENFLTRAALFYLFRGEDTSALHLLSTVRPTDAFSGRALYWLYHLQKKHGKDYQKTYQRLLSQHRYSFHSLLAQEEQSEKQPTYEEYPEKIPNRSKRSPLVNPMVQQVEVLFKYGFYETAGILVEWALDKFPRMETGLKVYLASMGDPKAQVQTVSQLILYSKSWTTQKTLELAYPRAYFGSFATNSGNINPLLLLSIARKESVFNPKAVSPANARGLLQLMPETAGKLDSGTVDLLDPQTNINLGSQYVRQLMDTHDGKMHLVLASYNAGDEPVAQWKKRYPTEDGILFVDLIPYRETRNYIGFVLSNFYWYKKLYEPEVADNSLHRELKNH